MILHLLRMRRNVNRNVFNDRKNVSVTTVLNKIVYSFVITNKQIGPIPREGVINVQDGAVQIEPALCSTSSGYHKRCWSRASWVM